MKIALCDAAAALHVSAKQFLAASSEAAKRAGAARATLHVKDKYPAQAIVAATKEQGCDLIVMASHGRGAVRRLLLGSEALKVLTLGTVPVLMCR